MHTICFIVLFFPAASKEEEEDEDRYFDDSFDESEDDDWSDDEEEGGGGGPSIVHRKVFGSVQTQQQLSNVKSNRMQEISAVMDGGDSSESNQSSAYSFNLFGDKDLLSEETMVL